MTTISVIIPSLNSLIIDKVVTHVCQQTFPPKEIIVVGRDEVGRLSQGDYPCPVRFLDTGTPIGPAAARNRGAALATGTILCFLDADCLADPHWIERLLARHAAGAEVVGGGVSLPPTNYWTRCDNLASFSEFLDITPAGERPYLPSLNFSIRRDRFLAIGGFDERFLGGEDVDLSLRLRHQGQTLYFEPRAKVTHSPARHHPHHLWLHARAFATAYRVQHYRYPHLLGRSLRVDLCRYQPALALLLLIPLAFLDSLLCYASQPSLLRYWTMWPGVLLAKLGWYSGLLFFRDRISPW